MNDMICYICVEPPPVNPNTNISVSVGTILPTTSRPGLNYMPADGRYYMPADGRYMSVYSYPHLFEAIGHTYSPRATIEKPLGRFKKFFQKLGFKIKPSFIPNPDFNEDYFHLPDTRDQWVVITPNFIKE